MSKQTKPKFSAATCRFNQLCRVTRDNFECGDYNLMTDTLFVWLSEQPLGENPKQKFAIPRSVFNRLVRRYQRPQVAVRNNP